MLSFTPSHHDIFKENLHSLLKAMVLTLSVGAILLAISSTIPVGPLLPVNSSAASVATVAYTSINYPQLGANATPLITLPTSVGDLQTPITYLIDTGALITSIPHSYAGTYHLDLAALPRIILSSLTTQTVFGYVTTAKLGFGSYSIELPITLAAIDTPVLGRQGLLDNFTLVFDHTAQTVTLATTQSN